MTMTHPLARMAVASALALAALAVPAADEPAPTKGDLLAPARALIADRQWAQAIDALKKVNDTRSADWHNLMGYSHRKAKVPDLAAAERHYNEALRLDARHKGALEYSGELYLMLGDLPKAQVRLAALQSVCGVSCDEYRDLQGAVDRFVAAGHKYTPK